MLAANTAENSKIIVGGVVTTGFRQGANWAAHALAGHT